MFIFFKDAERNLETLHEAEHCVVAPRGGDYVVLGDNDERYEVVEVTHVLKRGDRQVLNVHLKVVTPADKTDDIPYVSAAQARTYSKVGKDGVVFGYADIETIGRATAKDFNLYSIRSNVGRYRRSGLIDRLAPGRFKLTKKGAKTFNHNAA